MNPDPLTVWVQIISSVGFPIAVAMYLLMRFEAVLARLTESIEHQTAMLALIEQRAHRRHTDPPTELSPNP